MTPQLLSMDEMNAFGLALGRDLPTRSVVWLEGEMGAGKTTLARAITRGRDCTIAATSPTYSLVHRYTGPRGDVYHLDCYRLRHPDEAVDLDWEAVTRSDLVLLEWPERAGSWAPRPTCRVRLMHRGEHARQVEVT